MECYVLSYSNILYLDLFLIFQEKSDTVFFKKISLSSWVLRWEVETGNRLIPQV